MMRAALAIAPAVLWATVDAIDTGVGGVKFRNIAHRPMKLFWRSPQGVPDYAGRVGPDGGTSGFQTYSGHTFFWAEEGEDPPAPTSAPGAQHVEFSISEDQRVYYYEDNTTLPDVKAKLDEELAWMREYKARTGREWVGTTWPRPPVSYEMWKPQYVGHKTYIPLDLHPNVGQFHCDDYTMDNISKCLDADGVHVGGSGSAYQTPLEGITLECVSVEPKAFRILGMLSDFETDYIINQASPRLHKSTVGNGADARENNVRTSKSAWIHRGHSEITEAIYARVQLVTRVPVDAVKEANVESLNVLNYPVGAEYTPHYDWGANGEVQSRFVTTLLFLNTPEGGGATSFPRAKMPDGSQGTEIPAVKGTVAFFYSLLEDGNADELSLHAGTPVTAGEKWIAPLWIWEPIKAKWPSKGL